MPIRLLFLSLIMRNIIKIDIKEADLQNKQSKFLFVKLIPSFNKLNLKDYENLLVKPLIKNRGWVSLKELVIKATVYVDENLKIPSNKNLVLLILNSLEDDKYIAKQKLWRRLKSNSKFILTERGQNLLRKLGFKTFNADWEQVKKFYLTMNLENSSFLDSFEFSKLKEELHDYYEEGLRITIGLHFIGMYNFPTLKTDE